jgi:hypothetical protein
MARQQWARPGIGTAAFPLVTENPVSAGARNTVLGGFQLQQPQFLAPEAEFSKYLVQVRS